MECSICCEKINKSTHKLVTCTFCPIVNGFQPCLTCVKRYLLETTQNAHCMNCKHEWSRVDLYTRLPKVFLNGEYKARRQEISLEKEKSMMPATQPYVEIALERRDAAKMERDIQNIVIRRSNIDTYSDAYLETEIEKVRKEHAWKCLMNEIRIKERRLNRIQNGGGAERAHFVRKCPMEDCRGFLSSAWKCGLCRTNVCSKCHEPKLEGEGTIEVVEEEVVEEEVAGGGETKEDAEGTKVEENEVGETIEALPVPGRARGHVCDPNNVETANLLKKDSKPCPKCACIIFKISGCDQMFCTQCHTAFSWKTGAIETKVIHNPHYYQYLRDQSANGEIPRNPLDNPCADILPDGNAFTPDMMRYIDMKLRKLPVFFIEGKTYSTQDIIRNEMLICNHISAYQLNEHPGVNTNLDLRIKYMMHLITEDAYKQQLLIREKREEKTREFEMIFRTYVTAARDIILNFVNISEISEQIKNQQTIFTELENLRRYINVSFEQLIPIFNNTVWRFVKKSTRIDLIRTMEKI